MAKLDIGNRMKINYERASQYTLTRRTPVVIRLDGKAFHTFTKHFDKPFDNTFIDRMQDVTEYLVRNVQGCIYGYTQSDEISLVLIDYMALNTQPWFDYKVQKMCSVAASMATAEFNENSPWDALGLFDARAFNVPENDIYNYLVWRFKDWQRNSIQMVAQSIFSHKDLQNKSTGDMIAMCLINGVDWDALPNVYRYGTLITKAGKTVARLHIDITDGEWRDVFEPNLKTKNYS